MAQNHHLLKTPAWRSSGISAVVGITLSDRHLHIKQIPPCLSLKLSYGSKQLETATCCH